MGVMRLPWPRFVVRMWELGEGEGVVLGVVGRGVDVGCGTAISGAYIWGVVSEMVVVERFSADFGAYC